MGGDALRWAPAPLQPPFPLVSLLAAKTLLCVSGLTPCVLSPPRCGMLGVPIGVLAAPTLHAGGSAQKLGDFFGVKQRCWSSFSSCSGTVEGFHKLPMAPPSPPHELVQSKPTGPPALLLLPAGSVPTRSRIKA